MKICEWDIYEWNAATLAESWEWIVLLWVCRHTDYRKSSTKEIGTEIREKKQNHKHKNRIQRFIFIQQNWIGLWGKFPHAFALTLQADIFFFSQISVNISWDNSLVKYPE